MLTFTNHEPPQKRDVERLLARLDEFIAVLGDEFPTKVVARSLLVRGVDLILTEDGLLPTIWTVGRVQDLAAGHWTAETTNSFIEAYK
jgi:hypothetical protein